MTVSKLTCKCGAVTMEARKVPIVRTSCHCDGCREAGAILQSLPQAPPILDEDEGTRFILYRKDRVDCLSGCDNLAEHRLTPSSPTRRVVAACCNSFMFLDFTKGHWITVFADRIDLAGAARSAPKQGRTSAMFFLRLMANWAKMGFKTPTIDYVHKEIDDDGRPKD